MELSEEKKKYLKAIYEGFYEINIQKVKCDYNLGFCEGMVHTLKEIGYNTDFLPFYKE
jgi:hypothetical protein